jgi:hypothetical protein
MAYIDQARKAQLAPKIKSVLRKYGLKGSLRVGNHTSLILTVKSGDLDFISNAVAVLKTDAKNHPHETHAKFMLDAARYITKNQAVDVNVYHADKEFTGKCRSAVRELIDAMNDGNHDNSDPQTDYFDVGWYIQLYIGRWNKPYKYTDT